MAVAQAACAALDRHFGRTRGLPRARRGHHRRPPSGQARPRAAPVRARTKRALGSARDAPSTAERAAVRAQLLLQHRPRGLLRLAQCSRLPCGVRSFWPKL
eukprot:7389534-Prymnesium_polylepis.2